VSSKEAKVVYFEAFHMDKILYFCIRSSWSYCLATTLRLEVLFTNSMVQH